MSSTSSTNEVNTAYGVSTANTQASTASTQVSTANLSDDTVYAFLASQPNGSQLVHEDLEQIHEDDLEEMDLKWQLALLSMRTIQFFLENWECREISVLKSELEKLKQEKESNQLKIEKFDNASKSLDKLIGSQIPDKSRKGLGFEFQHPDFEGYGPKISKSVSEDISNEVMKSPDAPLVDELCSSKDSGLDNQERPANNTQDDNDAEPSINTANTNVNTGSSNINTINPKVTTAPIKATYDDLSGGVICGAQPLGFFEDPRHFQTKLQGGESTLWFASSSKSLIYVDDIIFGSTKKELCIEFEKLMHDKFQMSSMGELTFFLGLQVKQKEDGIFISQDKYVAYISRNFGFLQDVQDRTSTPRIQKSLCSKTQMCMRTRSQSRNRQQQQVPPTFVEPFDLEEPIDNLAPLVVTMADNRTMAQLLQAPTEGYEDAIVVPAITAENFEA
ncbi:ribonuclease H-like domain-containing protein [Tanacetum coccineum]